MMKLKTHLIVLVVGAVLPIMVFAIILAGLFTRQREQVVASGMLETARALTLAVDAELYSSASTLEAMAVSGHLSSGDLATFYKQCGRIRPTQRGWLSIYLLDANGRQLFNLSRPFGEVLPNSDHPELHRQIVGSGRQAIVGYFMDPIAGIATIDLGVPVWRDGHLKYILGATLDRQLFVDLLLREKGPRERLAAILDSHLLVIARSRADREMVGRHATAVLSAAASRSSEDFFKDRTLDGESCSGAFSRSGLSGWTVVLSIPSATLGAILVHLLRNVVAGGLVLLLAGVVVAGFYSRRISGPILALLPVAHALGRDEATAPRCTSSVAEVEDLCDAIYRAGQLLQDRSRERRAAEARRAQVEADLRRANTAKDEFLALLGHELRNPIGAISNAAEVLSRPDSPLDLHPHLREVIIRQTRQLARLVDDLLDVSRVTSGKIVLHPQPLDLGQLVRRCLDSLAAGGRTNQHEIRISAESVPVCGDPARLEQITANLIDNAVKYTPQRGLIQVSVTAEGEEAVLRVRDNGNGISEALLPQVFDLFIQEDRSLAHSRGGLGIGLTLVRRLAELHQGTVEARSQGPGAGSEFIVRLPRLLGAPAILAPASRPTPEAQHRVLVVDDNSDCRETLQAVLQVLGQQVEVAANGEEALHALRVRPPDIAFIDVGMPDIDGFELAHRVRAQPWGRDVFLVALTGYGQPEDRRQSAEVGFDLHEVKPISIEQLTILLADFAGRRATPA